jgi:hypothetical protein
MAIVLAWLALAGLSAQAGVASPPATVETEVRILEAPAGWGIEQIPIPLGFAPSLEFNGLEDIRFAPGWSDPGSPDFWTYKFVWEIAEDPRLDEVRLSLMLETYFAGLAQAVSQLGDALQLPAAVFIGDGERYRGRLRIYDAFTSKAWIYLNARVYSQQRSDKHLVVFEFSPQAFDHEVWQELGRIRVRPETGRSR